MIAALQEAAWIGIKAAEILEKNGPRRWKIKELRGIWVKAREEALQEAAALQAATKAVTKKPIEVSEEKKLFTAYVKAMEDAKEEALTKIRKKAIRPPRDPYQDRPLKDPLFAEWIKTLPAPLRARPGRPPKHQK